MNVLFISSYWYYADLGSSFIHAQAMAYVRANIKVRVLLPTPVLAERIPFGAEKITPFVFRKESDGVEIYYLKVLSLSNFGNNILFGKGINTWLALFSLSHTFRVLFHNYHPDVIHAHAFGFASDLGKYLKKRISCPLFVTTHGGDANIALDAGKSETIFRFCQGIDCVVTVSKLLESRIKRCGVNCEVWTNYLGCRSEDSVNFEDLSDFCLVSCSSIIPIKRVDLIIEALSMVPSDITIHWYHIGTGLDQKKIESMAYSKFNESSNINCHFLGFIPNNIVRKIYRDYSAILFITTSSTEGLPVSMMEAASVGLPLIGTAVGGVPEILLDKENGFLLDPNPSAEEVAKAIEKYWYLSINEKKKMSQKSVHIWEEKFDIDNNIRRLEQKYLEYCCKYDLRKNR